MSRKIGISHTVLKCASYILLLENIQKNLYDLKVYKDFVDSLVNAQTIKEKFDNLDFIKIKNVSSTKDSVKKMKKANRRAGGTFTTHEI